MYVAETARPGKTYCLNTYKSYDQIGQDFLSIMIYVIIQWPVMPKIADGCDNVLIK